MSNIRRSMMMAGRGGKPYDAEIEYLQCSGTQYIDTGIVGNKETKIEVKFNSSASAKYLFGSRSNSTTCITIYISTNAYQRFDGVYAVKNFYLNTEYVIELSKTSCVLNGDSTAISGAGTFNTPTTLWLMQVGGTSGTSTSYFQGKVYYCKIWDNGELRRDFIPVRVGTTGYMYDRVSGLLFGNAGTGSFTLGNDI